MEPNEMQEMFKEWLSETVKDYVLTGKDLRKEQEEAGYIPSKDPNAARASYEARFYTDTNRYSILALLKNDGRSYLGCIATSRKARAGEEYGRGNDLPDGVFSRDTWDSIVRAIVRYETIDIRIRPKGDLSGKTESQGDFERMNALLGGTRFVRIGECEGDGDISEVCEILMSAMPLSKPLLFGEIFSFCSGIVTIRPINILVELLKQASKMKVRMVPEHDLFEEDFSG